MGMPIIPVPKFPDVPLTAGVPPVARTAILAIPGTGQAINIATELGFFNGRVKVEQIKLPESVKQKWGLYDKNGKQVLKPDTILEIQYRDSAMIAKYPLEAGAFASYNKVDMPYDVRIVMAKGGNEKARRDFWAALQALRTTLDKYSIVMPDLTITDLNIVHRDLTRQQRSGANMMEVEIGFQQVRETGVARYSKTKTSGGADKQSVGAVAPRAPTAAEQQAGSASKDSTVQASAKK